MASPQLENGYTKIANELLERIISTGLNGTELACILFVIRKIYGYNKLNDEISLSQFLCAIPVSKMQLCVALRNLQLVRIFILVKKGNSKICSNLWAFNKDYDTWQLVRKSRLVRKNISTSKDLPLPTSKENLTYKRKIQKKIQKKGNFVPPSLDDVGAEIADKKYTSMTAGSFWNFYEAKGWMVGKSKMKNWKSALAGWEERNKKENHNVESAMEKYARECVAKWSGDHDQACFEFTKTGSGYTTSDLPKVAHIIKYGFN